MVDRATAVEGVKAEPAVSDADIADHRCCTGAINDGPSSDLRVEHRFVPLKGTVFGSSPEQCCRDHTNAIAATVSILAGCDSRGIGWSRPPTLPFGGFLRYQLEGCQGSEWTLSTEGAQTPAELGALKCDHVGCGDEQTD